MRKILSTCVNKKEPFTILSYFQIIGIIFFILGLPCVSFSQQIEKLSTIEGQLIRSIPSLKKFKPGLISPQTSLAKKKEMPNLRNLSANNIDYGTRAKSDPVLQRVSSTAKLSSQEANSLAIIPSAVDENFDGIGFTGIFPASPSIAAGPDHVIQMTNGATGSFFKIWDRDGNVVINQTILSSLFSGGGYAGESYPVAIYDQFADRYMMTELGTVGGSILVNTLVIAISQTNDPTGGWNLYKFTDNSFYHNYPHFAAWPNALYATTNDFSYDGSFFDFLGISLYAIDKNQMVAGNLTVPLVRYRILTTYMVDICPVNISGSTPPAPGSPGMFMYFSDDNFTSSFTDVDSVGFISLQPDFATPANSAVSFFQQIAVAPFKSGLCNYDPNCIPAPGGLRYAAISDRFMRRIYYRNFGTHESIVANHTVDANYPSPPQKAGVRWYEFRRTGGEWSTYQQGTYSPDAQSRWMGSIGINSKGQIALSYNLASSTRFGSFYFTGRNAGDALNQMSIAENAIINASGYGTSGTRWGAYNDMATDVVNDSLFWTTAMYGFTIDTWKTRVAAIKIGDIPVPLPTPPLVTINQAAGQSDPTSGSPIHFTVTFDQEVTGFTSSDISFTGSTPFILFIPDVTVTGGPIVYDVAVSGMTSSGTVIATVPAGSALNAASQSNSASTSTDNSVIYNIPPCSITCPSNITVAATSLSGAVVNYSVTPAGDCQNIVRVPVSGTTFPVGTTTVNAYNNVSTGLVYGLSRSTDINSGFLINELVTFNVNTSGPTTLSIPIPITGISFPMVAIDFRPSNGQLYGLEVFWLSNHYGGKIYTINKNTGVATPLTLDDFDLSDASSFDIDFDPVTDMLRVTDGKGTNLRIDPDLGTVLASDPALIAGFSATAYANTFASSTFTTLYEINSLTNALYIQGGINGIPSPNTGSTTLVGPLGVDVEQEFTGFGGFDISLSAGALATFLVDGASKLYSINLNSGAATLIGTFNGSVIDIAIAPITFPTPSCSFTVIVNPLLSPAPTVTINQAAGQSDPAVGSPINFTVIFDQAVTGFTSSDVSLSGTAGATTVVVTEIAPNNGTTFNVAVSGMTASGTVIASISANVALNSNNVGNTASSSTDNTVTFVNQSPDLTISKAPNTSEVSAGEEVGFTITVTNAGTGDALNVTITDALPTGLDWTLTSSPPGFSIVANVLGGNIGTLAAGENIVVTISAFSNAGSIGPITNTATVSCTNEAPDATSNNSSTATVTVLGPDIMVVKTANSSIVNGGGTVGFTITITNIGSGTAFGASVNDALPAGLNWTLTSPPSGFSIAANTLSGYISTLAPGASVAVTFTAVTATGYSGLITNTATVSCTNESVSVVNNNSSTATITVVDNSQPPTITCPGNITVYASPGECFVRISFAEENSVIITGSPAPKIAYSAWLPSGAGSAGSNNDVLPPITFLIGVSTVNITATNDAGTASCSFTVTVIDNQPPIIVCPENKVVNAEPGKCTSASVPFTIIVTEGCRVDVHTMSGTNGSDWLDINGATNMPLNGGYDFPVGINTVSVSATDASGNTSTCSFTVTVLDNENPVITSKPSDVTVECASQIPVVNIASVTATDNCGTPTITHVGDVIANQTCANKYTVTRTYKATDGSGNTATCSQLITVDDNTPPRITGLTSSKQVLWPANHKMVEVMLNYTVNDNCVSTPNASISITSNEPENGTGDGDTGTDWEIIDDHRIRIRAERAANGTGRIYTITVRVSDGCNASVSATTQVMVVHNITAPHSGNSFKVGSTVAFSGEFWDKPGNKHTAKWQIDGSTTTGAVTEPSGNKNGKVTGSYKFNTPGVYKLQMNVTDQTGVTSYANTNGDLEAIIVIYDPNGGHTYGGGYYDSRAGALVSNPSSTGKASYGFAMNYFKNSTNPKGETQFEFKVGDFEFNALNFDYLVISNSMAQFKGTGKIIGGQSGVAFTMTVTDGQLDGSGIDKIRMKIYNKNNGKIIYDNQPGASDAALPVQAVGANSIVVISGINSSLTSANTSQKTEMEATETKTVNGLDVVAYPNPSINNFSITVQASAKEKIMMQVVDMYGRIIETRNVNANSPVRFGDRYNPGTYFVRILQGKEHKEIKLVKLSN